MTWLASQGYRVVGSELSPLAVSDFLRECGATPSERQVGDHSVFTAGPVTIWSGDFFALPQIATRDVAAVYDRAALIAMPGHMQQAYAAKLIALAGNAAILLISLTYPDGQIAGPPFSTGEDQIRALFATTHDVSVLEQRDGLAASPNLRDRGITELRESVYLLKRRAP